MDKHTFLAIVVIVILALVFGWRFLSPEDTWICEGDMWVQHGNPSAPKPNIPCGTPPSPTIPSEASITPSTSKLVKYINSPMGFSLNREADIKAETNPDGSVILSKWGPSQKENTEFYDGYIIIINQATLGTNDTLLSLIQADIEQKKEQLSPDYQILYNPTPYSAWYKTGAYTYRASEPFGPVTYYYLPQKSGKFLLVFTRTPDPGNIGFETQAEMVVRSITINP